MISKISQPVTEIWRFLFPCCSRRIKNMCLRSLILLCEFRLIASVNQPPVPRLAQIDIVKKNVYFVYNAIVFSFAYFRVRSQRNALEGGRKKKRKIVALNSPAGGKCQPVAHFSGQISSCKHFFLISPLLFCSARVMPLHVQRTSI